MTIRRLSTREIYRNRWMTVREDEVERSNGVRGIYSVVEKHDSAIIIPIENNCVFLVEQFRYPIGENSIEFPQGSLEDDLVAPIEIARAELKEETGISSAQLDYLGEIVIAIGYSGQKTHAFVARNLTRGASQPEKEEHDLKVLKLEVARFEELVQQNAVKDAQTLAAWALYKALEQKER